MKRDELVSEYITINKELYKAWRKVFHAFAAEEGLTPTLIAALQAVQEMRTATGHHIAEKMRITDGAVAQLVDLLVRQEYVTRSTDSHDRRVINLVVTDKGERILADVKEQRRRMIHQLTATLSVDELRMANDVNKKLLQALEQ